MKKFFTRVLFIAVAFMAMASTAQAQQMPPIPVDQDVRIGKLPNGLTYYIRHNEKPKGQADFYIAQKVGSILENDDQRGLAHFLEHMCFNGTTHFPGSQIVDWLETKGVKFGYNLNAYTGVDETVYNISNVPVDNVAVQDSCLLILHDWANDLILDPEEIDKERGVIHQEWRRSMVGQMRILENVLPTVYPGSKYGYRLPIGTMEVVDNFPPQALRDYYETWYRPDQQGIVVVGDIDVDYIEGKIKEMFSDIEMPENAPERVYEPVADNEGTIFAIGSDKEQQVAIVNLMFKTDAYPNEAKGDMNYLIIKYVENMIAEMLNNRLSELANKPDTPFAQYYASFGNHFLAKTKDNLNVVAVAKTPELYIPTVEAIYREILRAQRGGFTYGEYERAQQEYLSRIEKTYNNRNNRESEEYVQEYVRNFIDNEPIPSIEDEYELMQMIVPNIPIDLINSLLPNLITPDNRVFLAMLPEKEGFAVPTAEELAQVMAGVEAEDIEPYVDEMKAEPLIPELPAPGKIVSESHSDRWDATELVLSNGAKVIVKPTTFKDDEILFSAVALGGTSVIPDSEINSLRAIDLVMGSNGLGDYTESDLQKYLAGKQVFCMLSFDDYDRSAIGSTTVKDLPTLMELLYMNFTNVTITPDDYLATQNKYAGILQNQESNPQYIFSRDVAKTLFDSPRKQMINPDDVRAAEREGALELIHNLTANAADYTFVFVGNIDMETFRPLVEQYIASLPADSSKSFAVEYNPALDVKRGSNVDTFTTKMETPQTYVFFAQTAELPYDAKNNVLANIAGQILGNRLLKTVREDMGAVYSIGAQGSIESEPGLNAALRSTFPMKPEMKQEVLDYITAEIANLESNITDEEVNKCIEYMIKEAKADKEENSAWLSAITEYVTNNVDTFNGDVELLQSITPADVMNYVKALRAAGNFRIIVLDPEAAE